VRRAIRKHLRDFAAIVALAALAAAVGGYVLAHQRLRFPWEGAPFRMLRRGDLRLWISGPGSSASRPMPDGATPEPGGWNRFVVEVDDIEAEVARLRAAGVGFRSEVVSGPGGKQAVLDDPAGNPVELFQPAT